MLDRNAKGRTSPALWVPVIWMLLAASRTLSQWVEKPGAAYSLEQLEGDPLERLIYTVLLAIGLIVLVGRRQRIASLLRLNWPILLFFAYCAMSIAWSDFPGVALKRWIKALGDPVMILIVLTDLNWSSAIERFLARMAFLLVPASVLLIKYHPSLGLRFSPLDGKAYPTGVTTNKNSLGVICLIVGIGSLWRVLRALRERQDSRSNRVLLAHVVILAMTMWLFKQAQSMTSMACFALAGGLIVATSVSALARKRAVMHLLVAMLLGGVTFALFLDAGGGLVHSLGKDPTLTGRAELWGEVIDLTTNPLFGAGFESFWTGSRLKVLWSRHWWRPNEAHNGYLEIFLNLGWTGVILLAIVLVTGYRNAVDTLTRDPDTGSLRIAFVIVCLAYSFTEAGFRMMSPIWICFMLGAILVPRGEAVKIPGASDILAAASRNPWRTRQKEVQAVPAFRLARSGALAQPPSTSTPQGRAHR